MILEVHANLRPPFQSSSVVYFSVSLSCSNAKSNEPRHRPTQRCSLPWARSPYALAVLMGSTCLRARRPHGPAVLMGSTSLGARPSYALAVLTALQSSWAPRPYGLPRLGTTFALALQDHVNPRDLESHRSKHPTE